MYKPYLDTAGAVAVAVAVLAPPLTPADVTAASHADILSGSEPGAVYPGQACGHTEEPPST